MLTGLRLENFKSFADQEVKLGPVAVLLGANAAGKSNFLEALRLLQGLALGFPLDEALDGAVVGGLRTWEGIRGGAAGAARTGSAHFTLTSRWLVGGTEFEHAIQCEVPSSPFGDMGPPSPFIAAESLHVVASQRSLLFQAQGDPPQPGQPGTFHVSRPHIHGGIVTSHQTYTTEQSLLTQLQSTPDVANEVLNDVHALRAAMQSTVMTQLDPERMRAYAPRSTRSLGHNGDGLAAILHRLCQDEEVRNDLVAWLSELCAPRVEDIEFLVNELKDVTFLLVEQGGNRIPARSLSDGTLHLLGSLVAFREAPKGAPLLMEEIEHHLHPARVRLMVEAMERTHREGAQFIVTTHSPFVLEALSEKALADAVVFGRHALAEGTVLRRLGDLPRFSEAVAEAGVEELFTTRWFELALP
jgi:predicted ATPase